MATFIGIPLTTEEEIMLMGILVDLLEAGDVSDEAILHELIRRAKCYDDIEHIQRICRKTKRDVEQTAIRNKKTHIEACGFEQISDAVNDVTDCSNGRIIELPCKVGATVYWLNGKIIMESVVESFVIDEAGVSFAHVLYPHDEIRMYGHNLDINSLGKTWFLSREDAERQLTKLEA